jgi:hypothetical protein
MHAKSVSVPGDRDHRRTEYVEALIRPPRGLYDPPPTEEVRVYVIA